jgi:MiaB-like tRNA modifying enzyme
MNQGEADAARRLLASMGHEVVSGPVDDGPEPTDAVLIFTCDVISSTERRMWKRMREVESEGKRLFVAGCLAVVDGERVLSEFPDACILDTMGIPAVESAVQGHFSACTEDRPGLISAPMKRLDHVVNISTGCLGSCTYCITRHARGALISNRPERVMSMVQSGVDMGRKEVLLTCQDTAAYGADLGLEGVDLGSLLRDITSNTLGTHMVRVGMMNPSSLLKHESSILDGFKGDDIFKFFHIPVQSGSDHILKAMGRGHDAGTYMGLIDRVRGAYPWAVLSTDIIVGFPGESEEDHRRNIELVRELRPEILNLTRFSTRPGTPAASMEGQVHGNVSKERSRELTRAHREVLASVLNKRLGLHRGCLVSEAGKREGTMMARDRNYLPIVIPSDDVALGETVDIITDRAGPTYLIGKVA